MLRKESNRFSQKNQKLSKSLIFLHSFSLNFLELYFEQLLIFLYILFVQNGIAWHFDCDLLQFFEKGIICCLFIFLFHGKLKFIINNLGKQNIKIRKLIRIIEITLIKEISIIFSILRFNNNNSKCLGNMQHSNIPSNYSNFLPINLTKPG